MNESRLRTIEQLREFLDATPQVQFSAHGGDGDSQRYKHISAVLRRFDYPGCSKADRGVVRAYLVRTTGYSRAQLTRLVSRWGENRLSAVPLAKCNRSPVVTCVERRRLGESPDPAPTERESGIRITLGGGSWNLLPRCATQRALGWVGRRVSPSIGRRHSAGVGASSRQLPCRKCSPRRAQRRASAARVLQRRVVHNDA